MASSETAVAVQRDSEEHATLRRVAVSSFLGNFIEWFDYASYSYLATVIAMVFFPAEDHAVAVMSTFGVFALSFLVRPIGAIFWGNMGDKKGRKWALSVSILLMSGATFLIGCLPGYAVIGVGAPLLLLLLLALLAALRLYLCAPAQVAGRQKNANDALLVWYRAAEDALLCMGIAPLPGEAPASFLWRAQGELHDAVKLTGLGKALCVAQYSGRTLKRTQPERAQKVYAALFAQMTTQQKLRLFARRFIRGIRL